MQEYGLRLTQPALINRLWEEYRKETPRPGPEFDEWCEVKAGLYGIKPSLVRRAVSSEVQRYEESLQNRRRAAAQMVADTMGLDLATTLGTVKECMEATSRKFIIDAKTGVPMMDENRPGQFMFLEAPDYKTRLNSAKLMLRVHGAMAPEKHEVKVSLDDDLMALSPEQLLARLAGIQKEVAAIHAQREAVIDVEFVDAGGSDPKGQGSRKASPRDQISGDPE